MDQETKRTELSSLGEFGLIDHLTKNIRLKNSSSIFGVGDDAAVLNFGKKHVLVSTDLLVENIHFDLSYTPLKHLGYKAAIVNFSDIAAMNGVPKQLTVSVALSNRFSLEAIEEIYDGITRACEKYGVDLIGGDTSSSTSGLFLSLTIIGEALEEEVVYRSGAAENDLLCVSGDLGGAYLGLLLLEREKQVFAVNPNMQPDLESYEYVLGKLLKPEARTDLRSRLLEAGIKPTAMIDISDGLASEILHICHQSKKGCQVFEDKIPIDVATISAAENFNIDPSIAALNGGEDYELLFTIPLSDFEKIKAFADISVIGHISDAASGCNLVSRSGQSVPLNAQGWDALLKKQLPLKDA
jgi:thiamine-monophosphate kinase